MKTKTLLLNFVIACSLCGIWTGCVTTYKPIELDYLSIDDYWNEIPDADVQIAMDDDVLTGPGTKKYAKVAKKNHLSLVVITMQNSGKEEFSLSGDLEFQTSDGFRVHPLGLEAALETLIYPLNDFGDPSVVAVEGDMGWIWGAGKVANDVKKAVSHVRFANDMMAYYLENRRLMPDSTLKGLLVLPVQKDTPLDINLQHNFRGR